MLKFFLGFHLLETLLGCLSGLRALKVLRLQGGGERESVLYKFIGQVESSLRTPSTISIIKTIFNCVQGGILKLFPLLYEPENSLTACNGSKLYLIVYKAVFKKCSHF